MNGVSVYGTLVSAVHPACHRMGAAAGPTHDHASLARDGCGVETGPRRLPSVRALRQLAPARVLAPAGGACDPVLLPRRRDPLTTDDTVAKKTDRRISGAGVFRDAVRSTRIRRVCLRPVPAKIQEAILEVLATAA